MSDKQLVSQWWAKGETAVWLQEKKKTHGTILGYIRSLIAEDMRKSKG